MWHEYSGLQPCLEALTEDITQRIRTRLQEKGSCTLAVSGGRSPVPLFERLATADLAWPRVRVRLVDERYVSPTDPDSNERLVRNHLLTDGAAMAQFRGLYLPGAGITEAVSAANEEADPIDLALLGMGEDGHTASLFPRAPQLQTALAAGAPRYVHITPPHAPYERISLSLPALLSCRHLILYIAGARKREVLRQAEHHSTPDRPISYLAAEPGDFFDVHWHP